MIPYSRKHDPAIPKRQSHFARWVSSLLVLFSLSVTPLTSFAADEVIDLLVVYTPQAELHAKSASGGDINSMINDLIKETNTSYTNSSVTQQLNEVHRAQIAYEGDKDKLSTEDILVQLTTNQIPNVHDLRGKNMADVTVLLVGNDAGGCGNAHQLNPNKPNGFAESAFAVVTVGCAAGSDLGGYSFSHQLGHLMGCKNNDKTINGNNVIMNDSFGFQTNNWSKVCANILNKTAETVAKFRSPQPGKIQFSAASQSVNEDVGTVTFDVVRVGGKNGRVSIEIAVSDTRTTAKLNEDYKITSSLNPVWEDWDDSPRTITVQIIDDTRMEYPSSEHVQFALLGATLEGGATRGKQKTHRIIIKDNDGADTSYVIDVTGSMGFDDDGVSEKGEIVRTANSLTRYTQNIVKRLESGKRKSAPAINFVEFRDGFYERGITNDLAAVQKRIDGLYAAGGGECPEGSVEAIQAASLNTRQGGQIMLYTDADPHPDLDIDGLIADLKKKGIRVHVKLTGECEDTRSGSPRVRGGNRMTRDGRTDDGAIEVYSRIAFETNGSFAYIPEVNDGTDISGTRYENSIYNTMMGTDEPAIVDVNPSTVLQGATSDLVLTAASTNFNESSTVNFGNSITVNNFKVLSATQIIANVTVPANITSDFYDVTVTTTVGNDVEVAEGAGPLFVAEATGNPELVGVTPYIGIVGTGTNVNISGLATNFDETTTVNFGNGITVQNLTVHSSELMTATVDVTTSTKVGLHSVVVETGNERVAKANSFLVLSSVVNNSSVAKITEITPSRAGVDSTVNIKLSGQTTHFVDEESFLEFSGSGIKILTLNVIDATNAVATIGIADDAEFGYRDVFITTGDETAALLNGFEIAKDIPKITQINPSYAFQDQTLDIEMIGQYVDFSEMENILVDLESMGVSVLSTAVQGLSQLITTIQIDESATMGMRNVSIDTEEVAALRQGLEIFAEIAPTQPNLLGELERANLYAVLGTIVDENGQPIEGVQLTVGDKLAKTDANGFWYVYGLEAGTYTIAASHKVHEFEQPKVELSGIEVVKEVEVRLGGNTLPIPQGTLNVTVTGDGQPLEGVSVQVGNQTVTTDVNGEVTIDLPVGSYTISASKEGYTFESEQVELGEDETSNITLTGSVNVTGDYSVFGTIHNEVGEPVVGVTIEVDGKTITTDENGGWKIGSLLEGAYTAMVSSDDGTTFMPVDFEVGNEQLLTEIVLKPLTELKAKISPKDRQQKAEQGKNIAYTISAVNGGDKTATNGLITYEIPNGTSLVSIQGLEGVNCDGVVENNTTTCTLSDLSVGSLTAIDVELSVGQAGSSIANVVTLTSNEYTPDVAKTATKVKPYLSVFGSATPSPVVMGGDLHYEFDVELNDNAPQTNVTGIQLEVQLPKGLDISSMSSGCRVGDTSTAIICDIQDLSIVNPGDVSYTTISLDTKLTDPGLIKLVAKAKVTSVEYSEGHTSRVRAEVNTQNIVVDGIIVIDLTWSMNDELEGVIRQVKQYAEEGFANGTKPLIAIVSFRDDDDIKVVTATRDLEILLQALNGLEAKDGGMCPEASADALVLGLNHLKSQGTLIFITDAPVYDDAETLVTVEKIKAILSEKEVDFRPIISEMDCGEGSSNFIE